MSRKANILTSLGKELNSLRPEQIIRYPVVTEKSTSAGAHNQYVFTVDPCATKPMIKKAITTLFKVKVESINTVNRAGKTKNYRNVKGVKNDRKYAIVKLALGQTIDVQAGVK